METVYNVRLSEIPDSVHHGDVISRLMALRHRVMAYTSREYTFPGNIVATARGTREPIIAKSEEIIKSEVSELAILRRKTFPVPYLDWSEAVVRATTPTIDVLITNRTVIRIRGLPGNESIFAEITACKNPDQQVNALKAVCDTVGLQTPRRCVWEAMSLACQ